jgi:hypothetical protein
MFASVGGQLPERAPRITGERDGIHRAIAKVIAFSVRDGIEMVQVRWSRDGKAEWIAKSLLNAVGQQIASAMALAHEPAKPFRKKRTVSDRSARAQAQQRRQRRKKRYSDNSDDKQRRKRHRPREQLLFGDEKQAKEMELSIDTRWQSARAATAAKRAAFPELPSHETLVQCIQEFRRLTSISSNTHLVCAVCGESKLAHQVVE